MNSPQLPPRNSKFDFLTDVEMEELVDAYYVKIENVKSLIERFKLPVKNNLNLYFPYFPSDEVCSLCNRKLYTEPHNRNLSPNRLQCLDCKHSNLSYCYCETCVLNREEAFWKNQSN
jgi:hypothetical protein